MTVPQRTSIKKQTAAESPVRAVRRPRGEPRRLLLDAARELFARQDYRSTTTREIAEAAEVSEYLLFRHFGSKAGLFREALVLPFTSFVDEFGRTWQSVIPEETDEEALRKRDFFIKTSDQAAMAEWARVAGMDFSRATYQDLAVQTFMAIPYVAGSYQTVANYLDGLAENGLAGVCFIFPDYEHDLQRLVDQVLPRINHHRSDVRAKVDA